MAEAWAQELPHPSLNLRQPDRISRRVKFPPRSSPHCIEIASATPEHEQTGKTSAVAT
jgi:hypothetical protein